MFAEFMLDIDQAPLHETMQHWMSSKPSFYCELPRGHGKSVQVAVRCAWEIGHNPEVRIKCIMNSDDEALKTLKMTREIIESPEFGLVFPHVEPASPWGAKAFTVKRKRRGRDATMECRTIFGRAGGRADILIPDDICDLNNSIRQPALRNQVKEFWHTNWLPMLDMSAEREPRTWKFGTPYHVADITADWRQLHMDDGTLLRRPCTNFESPWGSVYTRDILHRKRAEIGPIAYARSYELSPVSSDQLVFPSEWLDRAMFDELDDQEARAGEMVAAYDFAFTEKKQDNDPDWSTCIIGLLGKAGHVYVYDMLRVRSSFPEFCRASIDICNRYNVSRAKAEANGPQKGLVQQLNRIAPYPVMPVNRDKDKITRAAEKQSYVESGRFHIRAEQDSVGVLRPVRALRPLYDEMTTFPAGEHDDTVDGALDLMSFDRNEHGRVLETPRIRGRELKETFYGKGGDRPRISSGDRLGRMYS